MLILLPSMTQDIDPRKAFVYSPWWDTTVKMLKETPPDIHQKLLDIRKLVGGLKAEMKSGGPRFAVKSSAALVTKVRAALDATGCHAFMVRCDAKSIETETGTAAEASVTMRVCAPDGSFVDFQGYGQGADRDDKAGGKAVTYAQKAAWVYGLQLPDADMKDTDDEEGVAPVKKGTKESKDLEAAIKTCTTEEEMADLKVTLLKQPTSVQLKLSPVFGAQLKAIREGKVGGK